MKSKIIKLFSLTFALLLFLSAFSSCGKGEKIGRTTESTGSESLSEQSSGSESPARTYSELKKEDLNQDITVLTRGPAILWDPFDWDCDTYSEDSLNNAVYTRNQTVERDYNITITQIKASDDASDLLAKAQTSFYAGDNDYDIVVMPIFHQIANMAASGYYRDLSTVSSLDLNAAWWDQNTNFSISLYDRYYTICGDVNVIDDMATWCVLFNKKLVANFQSVGNLYEAVQDGSWTMEKMYETAALFANKDDQKYGVGSQMEAVYAFLASGNSFTFVRDENGDFYDRLKNAAFQDLFERIYNRLSDDRLHLYGAGQKLIDSFPTKFTDFGTLYKEFASGNMMFLTTMITTAVKQYNIASMDDPYGILPISKSDSEVEAYYSTMDSGNATAASIMIQNPNYETVGKILTAMSACSVNTLTPEFYTKTLQRKKSPDEESGAMLNIIFANRVVDFGVTLSSSVSNILQNTLVSQIGNNSGYTYHSKLQSYISTLYEEIEKITDAVKTDFAHVEKP